MRRETVIFLVANFFVEICWGYSGIFGQIKHGNVAEYPKCQKHLEALTTGLENRKIWALKIVDASTKFPAGILTGHLTDYGNFDECLEDNGKILTQYCQAKIHLPVELTNQITKNDSSLVPDLYMSWAYCIPASCPAAFLQKTLENFIKDEKFNVTVDESNCIQDEAKHISDSDFIGIFIWVFFGLLTSASTIYDINATKKKKLPNKWLTPFSFYTNGSKLLKIEITPKTLPALYGLRFLSICWIVLGHRYFFTATSSLLNLTDFREELKKIQSQFYIQGVLAVDTFFLLSGFLNCHYMTQNLENTGRFQIVKYYVCRYVRLTPALAAIVLMYATWYSLLGDGPEWHKVTHWKQLCVENWAPTLLYISNYYNPTAQCAGQSWYLSVDMQLYWLSPFIIYPIMKWPRIKYWYLGILVVVSIISPFVVAYENKFRMGFTFGLNVDELARVTEKIYSTTHTRGTPYIIGIIIAYYLRKPKNFSKKMRVIMWLLSIAICSSVFLGNFQFSRPLEDHPYNRLESSAYIALHRLGWSVGIGWVIVASLTGYGGIVNRILSWKIFQPLSRLTYSIFLTHMGIQQYHVGTRRTSDYFHHFNQIHDYFGDLCLSIFAAIILNLLFESPFLVLGKLIGDNSTKQNSEGKVNTNFEEEENKVHKVHENKILET